jgi:hypothetical protein
VGPILLYLAVGGVLAAIDASRAAALERDYQRVMSVPDRPTWPVGRAEYDRLELGMTYGQAATAMGWTGEEAASSATGGGETETYSWPNPDGSRIVATFRDNRLISKRQFGLH